MTFAVSVVLPGPPEGKQAARAGAGFVYTPAKTRRTMMVVRQIAVAAMEGLKPFAGPLKLVVDAKFAVPKSWPQGKRQAAFHNLIRPTTKPDFDNICKMIDGMKGIVFVDDAQIIESSVQKYYRAEPETIFYFEAFYGLRHDAKGGW